MAKPKKTPESTLDNDVQESQFQGSDQTAIELSDFDKQLALLNSEFDEGLEKAGLRRVIADVDGYWEPSMSPIFGELVGTAKAIQTELGTTGIYAIKLLKPCACRLGSKQESDVDILPAGKVVGVFHSVGLNPLKTMAGAKVAIRRTGSQKLSGARTMHTYDILADGVRAPIEIIDNRKAEDTGAPF